MKVLIDNWYIIFGLLALVIVVIFYIKKFIGLPTDEQIKSIKEWLKYAVTIAEKELQSGTGQLKLRMVYDMFIDKFPEMAKIISFTTFAIWVDEALEWLTKQISQNKNIKNLVDNYDKKQL